MRAHVVAARRCCPGWLERGSGYFLSTASAAGLLTQIGSAPYAVTKHAAVAFAEWLSVTYGDRGVGVSCLCPMGVNTPLLEARRRTTPAMPRREAPPAPCSSPSRSPTSSSPPWRRAFLVLPHPEVLEFFRRKGADYDRWLAGMRRLQASVAPQRDA